MRIAKIILMILLFSVVVINLIFAIAFHDWYTYSGWFLALWFCCIAYGTELQEKRRIEAYKEMIAKGTIRLKEMEI